MILVILIEVLLVEQQTLRVHAVVIEVCQNSVCLLLCHKFVV